ncbi:MAG: relaxase/mobilization nuclease domain-containing protein [Dysgonamonadaceae bacterium]|jgi:hypothetical protein|nr:relaxase/mobilization nuclease domain-containing protein [Dysgonamonadaceae bacterium]
MVAKMSSGNSIYGALSYNQNKVDDAHAKVIFAANMKDPEDGIYTMTVCLQSFESRLMANQKTEKPVLHVSLNPDPKDRISDEQLSEIAQEYMQKMGYGEQPYVVFKHEDIERRHIHIVSLRVDSEGKKINDKFEHRRSMDICRELEQKYGLIPADKKQRQGGLPLKKVDYEKGDLKHQIANVIRPIAQSWHFQSLKEYRALLTLYNTGVDEVRGEIKGQEYKGLVYSALNGKGEKVGNPFKSSLFGKSVGIEALEKSIEKSTEVIKNKRLKERSKQVIAAVMHSTDNRADFEKALEKQGISVLFRTNDEGRIYGATFIDHEQKCVFNGSRLGKEFSANVFNGLFNSSHKAEQSFEQIENNTFHEKENGTGIGGLFDILPEAGSDATDNMEEQSFIRRLKKKKRRTIRRM